MYVKYTYYPNTAQNKYERRTDKEFARWEDVEKALGCEIYFADTYCAWWKGTNENLNGLLREFYPKGRNLSHIADKTLQKKSGAFKRQT